MHVHDGLHQAQPEAATRNVPAFVQATETGEYLRAMFGRDAWSGVIYLHHRSGGRVEQCKLDTAVLRRELDGIINQVLNERNGWD